MPRFTPDQVALAESLKGPLDRARAIEFLKALDIRISVGHWSAGDFVDRFSRLVCILQEWTKDEFYAQVAEEAGDTADDPWVDASVHSFFGALKRSMGDASDHCRVGELQEIWDRA